MKILINVCQSVRVKASLPADYISDPSRLGITIFVVKVEGMQNVWRRATSH